MKSHVETRTTDWTIEITDPTLNGVVATVQKHGGIEIHDFV